MENSSENIPGKSTVHNVAKKGGVHYDGGVQIFGGEFVGRDKLTVYQGLTTEEVAALVVELKQVDQPTVWDGRIPYIGLSAFQESDAQFFFGRESLVDDLLKRVTAANFIVIAGPSGSGKSSVARAGLFQALRNGRLDKSDTWLLATMTPGGNPIEQLAAAVVRVAKTPSAGDHIRQQGLENGLALLEQIDALLSDDPRQRFVLLVDQFEETFTQTKDEATRAAFLNLLTAAAQTPDSRAIILLALRSDFISHCARYPDLRELMSRQFQLVGAMEPHELAKAITLPALEVGTEIDPALVSRIIADMKGEPGALPLMSFALRDLFEFEAQKTQKGKPLDMTLPDYLTRGGVESALERHANQVFANFTEEQQELAKTVFSRLIEVGQGRQDTRRTAVFTELIPAGKDAAAVAAVVDALAREGARLLTASGGRNDEAGAPTETTVTIAHEKLIDAWPWLRQLVDENREAIALQNQIASDAQAWAQDKDAGYLYRGGRLAQVEERLAELEPGLSKLSQQFIQSSIDQRQREIDEKESRERHKLEQERALAAAQRQRAEEAEQAAAKQKRLSRFAFAVGGVALILFIVAGIAGVLARNNAEEARANEALAETRQSEAITSANLAATREQEAEESAGLALTREAEARASAALAATSEANAITNANLAATREAEVADQSLNAQTQALMSLSISLLPANRNPTNIEASRSLLMVAQGLLQSQTLANPVSTRLLDEQSRRLLAAIRERPTQQILTGHENRVGSVAFDPQGRWLASGSDDWTIWLWDLSDLDTEPHVLSGHVGSINSVAFDPQGRWLASGSGDQTIWLWDLSDLDTEPRVLSGYEGSINSVAFDSQGRWLASGGGDQTIWLWDLSDLDTEPRVLSGHEGSINSVAFDPQGRWLASGSFFEIRLWSLSDLDTESRVLASHERGVNSVAFDPAGRWLASGSFQEIRLWDLFDLDAEPHILAGHGSWVNSMAFDPAGHWLASGSADTTIRLWVLSDLDAEPHVLTGHFGDVRAAAFDPGRRWLASGSGDRTIRLWDLSDWYAEPRILAGHGEGVRAVAFDPGRRWLASGSDWTIWLWELSNPDAEPHILAGHNGSVMSVAFDPVGHRLASGSFQEIRLWDLFDLDAEPRVLTGHDDWIYSVAFDPAGRWLASGSEDRTIWLWDLADLDANPRVLEEYGRGVSSVAFDPAGHWLASASSDTKVRLWDLSDPDAEPYILVGHEDWVLSVAFDPAGRWLASGSYSEIRLWDISDLDAEPRVLAGHEGGIRSLAFDPAGRWLASGSDDQTVWLWDMKNLSAGPSVLAGHEGSVYSVAFDPEGHLIASGSIDGTVRLWRTMDDLAVFVCEQAGRNFSWDEWQEFLPGRPYRPTCPQWPIHPSVPAEMLPETESITEKSVCQQKKPICPSRPPTTSPAGTYTNHKAAALLRQTTAITSR
jgi:WD40 repeat protein